MASVDTHIDDLDSVEIIDGDAEIEPRPVNNKSLAINKPARGRPRGAASSGRERLNSYRHSDNHIPKRVNEKPSREVESLIKDNATALKTLPDGQGRFVGYNLPSQVTDRFDRMGFKLNFFVYGQSLNEYTGYGWKPVMISEIPEIALAIVPVPGLFNEDLREYFIYRDHILMKISHADWEEYRRDWDSKMDNNERLISDSRSVRAGQRKHGMVYGRDTSFGG